MSPEKIRVTQLAFVHYQHPDLEKALSFLSDFGLIEESRQDDRVFMRGYGTLPFIHLAEKSPDGQRRFLGGYWEVDSEAELEKAASIEGATAPRHLAAPGGGRIVTVPDPNGNIVGFVYGQTYRASNLDFGQLERMDSGQTFNSATDKPRKGAVRRFQVGASPVHKLGHYGYMVPTDKFRQTLSWYTSIMNLKLTDCVYNSVTREDETVFAHIDLGAKYTDHHSFFLAANATASKAYVHHSSFEVNDFDTQKLGHDFLLKKGWTNCWGIGRHVLGSQIFDYWFDGSGNVVEHYSDGDLVNEDTPLGRAPAALDTLYVWGPNIPLGFATGRIEDADKPMPIPPDVFAAQSAQL